MAGIWSWVKGNIVNPVINAVKHFFGIKSPSTVMHGIGLNLVAGLLRGLATTDGEGHRQDGVRVAAHGAGALARKGLVSLGSLGSKAVPALGGLVGKLFGGGGGTSGGSNVSLGRQLAAQFGSGGQFDALNKLWTRESGWNTTAANPSSGAYGIPQALPASKMGGAGSDWRTNPLTQIKWGLGYIVQRYGSPAAAWAHELSAGWYDNGGVLAPGQLAKNFSRVPEVVLTKAQWSDLHKLVATLVAREKDKSRTDNPPAWLNRLVAASTGPLRNLAVKFDRVAATIAAAKQYATTTASNLKSGFDLSNFSAPTGLAPTFGDVLSFEQGNLSALKTFAGNITKLAKAGVSHALISQITALGPDQGNQVATAILAGGKANIKTLNATEQNAVYAANQAGRRSADVLYDTGRKAGKGFLTGLQSQEHAIASAMRRIANRMVAALRKALKIKSPSRVTHEIGAFTGMGLENGALSRLGHVQAAADRLAMAAIPQIPYGGTTASPAAAQAAAPPSIEVRVFIGDQELDGIVRTEIQEHDRVMVRRIRSGTGRR